jgi:hypothetical protein
MKTTKMYFALSLALIFAVSTSTFAAATGKIPVQPKVSRGIQHHVNVSLSSNKPLCNTYLVEIRDEHGQLIAPAQPYIGGVTGYDFFERGPSEGIRVALLTRANFGDRYICEMELFTSPVVLKGLFEIGKTYRYDLFPSTQPNKE